MGWPGPVAADGSTRLQISVLPTVKNTMVSMPMGSTTSRLTVNSQCGSRESPRGSGMCSGRRPKVSSLPTCGVGGVGGGGGGRRGEGGLVGAAQAEPGAVALGARGHDFRGGGADEPGDEP